MVLCAYFICNFVYIWHGVHVIHMVLCTCGVVCMIVHVVLCTCCTWGVVYRWCCVHVMLCTHCVGGAMYIWCCICYHSDFP